MRELPPYIYRNHVPHLRVHGAAYFITWRLIAGALDLTPEERTLIADTVKHFHPERYFLYAFVVMNDHVHVLIWPMAGHAVSEIVHSWKSYTANRLQRLFGRSGSVWQKDYIDHAIVSHKQLQQKAEYIYNNPFNRWPELKEYEWLGGNAP
jgi:REP element-mobilizing transposase RayT